jgi:hypothetical protein
MVMPWPADPDGGGGGRLGPPIASASDLAAAASIACRCSGLSFAHHAGFANMWK